MTYVFPHVPKCGGTSLLKAIQASGVNARIDYDGWMPPESLALDAAAAKADLSGVDLIFGHFPISRYDRPGHRFIALVRDPVERCLSSFDHHRNDAVVYPEQTDIYTRMGKWANRGELSFVEYVRLAPHMRDVYHRFLHYWPKDRFALVGTMENYDDFARRFSDLLGADLTPNTVERRTVAKTTISADERARAEHILADEYRWYRQFTAL